MLASGLHVNTKLSSVIKASKWCWPFTTNLSFRSIHLNSHSIVPSSPSLDSPFWSPRYFLFGFYVELYSLCGFENSLRSFGVA